MTREFQPDLDPRHNLELKLGEFLDVAAAMAPHEQLCIMHDFWNRLGHEVPALDNGAMERLSQTAEAMPGFRIVPAPLLDLNGRTAMLEAAKAFPRSRFHDSEAGLWIPISGTVYGELLLDPENMMRTNNYSFPLAYRAPDGQGLIVGRQNWKTAMQAAGKVVEAPDGLLWTFAVVNPDPHSPRLPDKSPGDLFAAVDPSVTPETALAVHLLHHANGIPNEEMAVNFVNEAVCKMDNDGAILELVEISGIRWYGQHGRTRLGHWVAPYYGDRTFGIVQGVSGL